MLRREEDNLNRIPKKIHYCWFGQNKKNDLISKCIQSWKKNLADYEIIEWNEKNFPLDELENDFVKSAFIDKNWAFVSDFVRLWVLLNEGGIYLDTDVEVVKDFDSLLQNSNFIGFEDDITLGSCVIGAIPNSDFILEIFNKYKCLEYKSENMQPNVRLITDIAKSRGLLLNGKIQTISGEVKIFSKDYFSPKSYITGKNNITKDTICIHHFNGSWLKDKTSGKNKIKYYLYCLIGDRVYNKIVLIKRNLIG